MGGKPSRLRRAWNKNAMVYLFLVPVLLHYLIFSIIPLAFSFILTFMDYRIAGGSTFAGLKHWRNFFSDDLAWRSLGNTLEFSLYFIIPTMALALILAMLIRTGVRGVKWFKAVYFLPVVTSFVILCGIWKILFQGTSFGIVNYLLSLFGNKMQLFLASSSQAMPVLAGLSIFKMCGMTMIYYLAGLNGIPPHLYEAAKIDGASPWVTFRSITFPLLKPIHFYVAVVTTIASFQIFDSAYMLTNGGPNYATTTIVFYLYQEAFMGFHFSYASVLAYALFFIVLLVSLIQRKWLGKEMSYI